MLIQVWLTVLLIAALILGVTWALIGRPFMQRWQMETKMEEEARQQAEEERVCREKALQEIHQDCYAPFTKEEAPEQQVQKRE